MTLIEVFLPTIYWPDNRKQWRQGYVTNETLQAMVDGKIDTLKVLFPPYKSNPNLI